MKVLTYWKTAVWVSFEFISWNNSFEIFGNSVSCLRFKNYDTFLKNHALQNWKSISVFFCTTLFLKFHFWSNLLKSEVFINMKLCEAVLVQEKGHWKNLCFLEYFVSTFKNAKT